MPHFFHYTSIVKQEGGMRYDYYYHYQEVKTS